MQKKKKKKKNNPKDMIKELIKKTHLTWSIAKCGFRRLLCISTLLGQYSTDTTFLCDYCYNVYCIIL